MNWREIIAYVVIGILLAIMGYLGYNNITKNKRITNQEIIIEGLRHPRITQIIRYDSIIWKDSIKYKPIPVKTIVHDTVWVTVNENWYKESFKLGDSVSFNWSAKTMGTLDSIGFSNLFIKRKTITNIQWEDTCIAKLPAYYPKSHLWIYGGATIRNFKEFPGIQAGLLWTFKDYIGIQAGPLYLFNQQQLYLNANVLIHIK